MQNYTIKENFVAINRQQIFKLNKPFVQGTINVFVNGALQSYGSKSDYVTLPDNGKIIFNRPLNEGDMIGIISNKDIKAIKVMSFGKRDTSNALYQRYSSVQKLKYNNTYKIHVLIDDTPIEWNFDTVLTPFYTTVRKIQEDIGEFIPGFTDKYISSMIHRNSWELEKRIQEALDDPDAAENLNENAEVLTIPTSDGEYENSYRIANNWVRYKTEIDLIYARYYGISFNYGTKEKSIGDISIKNERKLPYIDNLLDRLKKNLDDMENIIFGSKNFVKTFQKGSTKYNYNDTVARNVSWSS